MKNNSKAHIICDETVLHNKQFEAFIMNILAYKASGNSIPEFRVYISEDTTEPEATIVERFELGKSRYVQNSAAAVIQDICTNLYEEGANSVLTCNSNLKDDIVLLQSLNTLVSFAVTCHLLDEDQETKKAKRKSSKTTTASTSRRKKVTNTIEPDVAETTRDNSESGLACGKSKYRSRKNTEEKASDNINSDKSYKCEKLDAIA